MATSLIITGALFEVVGLTMVFVELAVIRSHEFAVPTPWARLARWVRRRLGRPQVIELGAALSAESALSAREKVRPGPADADATEADRIARLERYVDHLDCDVDELHRRIDDTAQQLARTAQQREQELRREMDRREDERRQALRPSLQRQAIGAGCVLAGLVLGTIGNVI
jgi:hypothetical protein